MLKKCSRKGNSFFRCQIIFSLSVSAILIVAYSFCACFLGIGVSMSANTAISTDIALITIIITSIGLSISGYIFLNNYFGTVVEGDRSFSTIIEGLNKVYIQKIILASAVSMFFIICAFTVIFSVKDAEGASAFMDLRDRILQHLTYVGSIGSILYNFHFLCHIINPDRLIKKRAFKVADDQIGYLVQQSRYMPVYLSEAGCEWRECKGQSESIDMEELFAGGETDSVQQTLGIVKYIYEIEAIITKVIELNALKGENWRADEALKFIFADTSVGDVKYERRMTISTICDNLRASNKRERLKKYEAAMSVLIEDYVLCYDHLVLLKNALIKMDEKKVKDLEIGSELKQFVAMMMRVTLKLFANFVKMTKLNIGGGYFARADLTWSDLSGSNLTGSNFSGADMEGAVFKDSDLSISRLDNACINDGDFRNVNLGYARLIGARCVCINLTNAKLTDVIFHEPVVIRQNEIIREKMMALLGNNRIDFEKLRAYSPIISNGGEIEAKEKEEREIITDLTAATMNNVVMKSVDLSAIKLDGASFENSVLTNSLWLYTTNAEGIKMKNANLRVMLAVRSVFSRSDFHYANLVGACFVDVDMAQSNLTAVNGVSMKICGSSEKINMPKQKASFLFSDRKFSSKDFKTNQIASENGFSKWVQVNMQKMNAVESLWCNTLLNESDFADAILKNTVWENIGANWVNMEKCDMTYSTISEVSFRMAKMPFCIFTRALLKNVSFENANLYKSNFIHANIKNVDFTQCNMDASILSHAVLQNCRFLNCGMHDIYLQSTKFRRVVFDRDSFLSVLNSYIPGRGIEFCLCAIVLDNCGEYERLIERINIITDKTGGGLSIKRTKNCKIVLINAEKHSYRE